MVIAGWIAVYMVEVQHALMYDSYSESQLDKDQSKKTNAIKVSSQFT